MAFPVDVELARKGRTSFGADRPRGFLILDPEGDQEERLKIPAAVARYLKKRVDAGEITCGSRAEALWHLGEAQRVCAVSRLEGLVNKRDYSRLEATRKLLDDGYSKKTVEDVIDRAVRGRVIDDSRFAEVFIRSKVGAGWGALRIERELARRGIEASDLAGWPYDYIDVDDEGDRAYQIASRRRLTGKNDYQKLVRFLMSRGFSMSLSCEAAKRVLREAEEDGQAV